MYIFPLRICYIALPDEKIINGFDSPFALERYPLSWERLNTMEWLKNAPFSGDGKNNSGKRPRID
jgi:hypothetical protein